ncbi:MAG: YcaO-like family protein [Thermodesulfobacteriota bacterium]
MVEFNKAEPSVNLIPKRFQLNPSPKGYCYGQHKAISPEETVQRALSSLASTGRPVFEGVSQLDHLDRIGIPAYVCKVNPAIRQSMGLTDTLGKGITVAQAQASALMELVERYSAVSFLENDNASHFITRYDDIRRYAPSPGIFLEPFERYRHNRQTILTDLCTCPLAWTWSYSLTQGKSFLFPLKWFTFVYGTTGFAAGNTLEEAILQAICEVVERHAISTVVMKKLSTPGIDPGSIGQPVIRDLISKFHQAGISVYIKDFSLDLGIPTVEVLAFDPEAPVSTIRIYNAAGTHTDKNMALIRALTEIAQHRCQIIERETIQKKQGGPTYCFPGFQNLGEAEFLIADSSIISMDDLPDYPGTDFRSEIKWITSALSRAGLEVFVTDVTHPGLGMPAVIVTIPGARLNRPATQKNPYFVLARSYMEMGKYQEAIQAAEKAFDLDPEEKNNPTMLCRIGICYRQAGLYYEAARLFQQALELKPALGRSPSFIKDFSEIVRHL